MIRLFRYAEQVVHYWKNGAIVSRQNNEEFILLQLLDHDDNLLGTFSFFSHFSPLNNSTSVNKLTFPPTNSH
jgi:hypothetical protein